MSAAPARWGPWVVGALALTAAIASLAWWRGGLLDLPAIPAGVTPESSGLADLKGMAARAEALDRAAAQAGAEPTASGEPAQADPNSGLNHSGERTTASTGTQVLTPESATATRSRPTSGSPASAGDEALVEAGAGLAALRRGDLNAGLPLLHRAIERAPADLVIGNAYRMALFRLKHAALTAGSRETLAPQLGPDLKREPIAFLQEIARAHPCRETSLQLALAWADELLLYDALEIKAPASVESSHLLSRILESDPWYVPALFGRGLNYLYRPARLVWPESKASAPDAASQDFGLCIAIGRRIGGASPRLAATLALALGDAYAKEGRPERARSWWQIAENADRDPEIRDAVRIRFGWQNDEMLDQLEAQLAGQMLDSEHPLSDLSVMWR